MKQIIVLMALMATIFVVGCTNVPDDVAQAEILDEPAEDLPAAEEPVEEAEEVAPTEEIPEEQTEEAAEAPIEEVSINEETKFFEFEGFAPGKSHVGTFDSYTGVLFVQDGEIIAMEGSVDVSSVNTGIEKLDNHLRADDFFDAANCPEIEFQDMEIVDGTAIGELTFHCVTHEVRFPVDVTADGISANFLLDTTPFGMKHLATDKNVRIAFDFQR